MTNCDSRKRLRFIFWHYTKTQKSGELFRLFSCFHEAASTMANFHGWWRLAFGLLSIYFVSKAQAEGKFSYIFGVLFFSTILNFILLHCVYCDSLLWLHTIHPDFSPRISSCFFRLNNLYVTDSWTSCNFRLYRFMIFCFDKTCALPFWLHIPMVFY